MPWDPRIYGLFSIQLDEIRTVALNSGFLDFLKVHILISLYKLRCDSVVLSHSLLFNGGTPSPDRGKTCTVGVFLGQGLSMARLKPQNNNSQ